MPDQPFTVPEHKLAHPLVVDLARRTTRVNPPVQVLRPDLMDQYAPIAHVLQNAFTAALSRRDLLLPDLQDFGTQTTAIYSDCSGESDGSYLTYSFLVCGWNNSFAAYPELKTVREKHGLGQKEIGFKDLGYGPMRRGHSNYLNTLDFYVPGPPVHARGRQEGQDFVRGAEQGRRH